VPLRHLKLTIAYDGTNYVGWQRQAAYAKASASLAEAPSAQRRAAGVSIQQLIEDACVPLNGGVPAAVAGAGRTDAGVHALGQVASVALDTSLDDGTLRRALNFRLPEDVRVARVEPASPEFHARFDAKGKWYRYRIAIGPVVSPFDRWFVWHAPEAREHAAMSSAAADLVGRHDFASFQAAGGDASETVRTIRRLDVQVRGDEITLDVEGDGFLRHMVRAIAGTLVDIGAGRRPADAIPAILAARDRRAAGATAPAAGLTLLEVRY
jgi:tRNA pseudouridine38-40 synthase